jgi:hypothetical protein
MTIEPGKADPPLVVDADTVLALTVALQKFQSVPRKRRKSSDIRSRVQHIQFAKGGPFDGPKAAHAFALKKPLGVSTTKGPDHRLRLYRFAVNVKQYTFYVRAPKGIGSPPDPVLVRTLATHTASNFLDKRMSLWYSGSYLIQHGRDWRPTPCPPKHIPSPPRQLHPPSTAPTLFSRPCLPCPPGAAKGAAKGAAQGTLPTTRSKNIPFPFNHLPTLLRKHWDVTHSIPPIVQQLLHPPTGPAPAASPSSRITEHVPPPARLP